MIFKYVALSVLIVSSGFISTGQTKDPYRLKAIDKTADYLCRFDKKENVYSPFKKNDIPNQDHITKQIEKFRTTSKSFVEFLLLKQTSFTTIATRKELTNSKDIPFRKFVDSLIIGGLLGNDPGRRNQPKFRSLTDTLKILIKEENESKIKPQTVQNVSAEPVIPEKPQALADTDSVMLEDTQEVARFRQAASLKNDLDRAVKSADAGMLRRLINDNKAGGNESIIEPFNRILTSYDRDLKKGDSMLDLHKYKEALNSYISAQSFLQSDEINRRITIVSSFIDSARRSVNRHLITIALLLVLIISGAAFVLIRYDSFSETIGHIEETVKISELASEGNALYLPPGLRKGDKKSVRLTERLENILKAVRSFNETIIRNKRTIEKLEPRIPNDAEVKNANNEATDKPDSTVIEKDRNEIAEGIASLNDSVPKFPRILYAIGPEENGFPADKLKQEKGSKSVYKITLIDESRATFEITEENDVMDYALANEKFVLKPACDYENSSVNGGIIRTRRNGELRRKEVWTIENKALIAFYKL